MTDNAANKDSVSQAVREQLLQRVPCFGTLSHAQYKGLSEYLKEIDFKPQQPIVIEGELVDSVYFIASGKAEVTRTITEKKKSRQVPVAVLNEGEAIGLNDTGFYSATGKRTATVTALTPMRLLRLDMKDLFIFLKENNLETAMYDASKKMECVRFIKQSLPFAKLSHDRLQWLAEHVDEISVPPHTVLFRQGEVGDKCYLIRSGEVEISIYDDTLEEHPIAVLKAPTLFGEATIITHSPRNATARTLTQCELFVLSQKNLSELIESERNVASMFMSLMIDRSRPLRNEHVTTHDRPTPDGQVLTILKNPQNHSYFKLSPEGAFVWQQLDGKHTLQDITLNLAKHFEIFSPDMVAALISKLSSSGFITNVDVGQMDNLQQTFIQKALAHVRKIIEFRYAIGDVNNMLGRFYEKFMRYFFTKPGQMILAIIAIAGFVLFILHTPVVLSYFRHNHISLLLLLSLIPFSMLEVLLHELGHAFTVKYFGRDVHYLGVGWYIWAPIAFIDTSDMWLATRKPRMLVNIAGVYVDVLIAGIAALLIAIINSPWLQGMLWLFALYTYIRAFRMLSPLQELDGYYILMDWIEKNRLRHAAVVWLVKKFPKSLKNPALFKENWPEISYWIACIIFLILVSILTLAVQSFVLTIIGIHTVNPYFAVILPFLAVIISSLSIVAEIRHQAEK